MDIGRVLAFNFCVHQYRKSPRHLPFDGQNGTDNRAPKDFLVGLHVFLPEGLQAKADSIIYYSCIFIL